MSILANEKSSLAIFANKEERNIDEQLDVGKIVCDLF